MKKFTEKELEDFIEGSLGYVKRVSDDYDRELCLDRGELIRFLEDTQSDRLARLKDRVGEGYREKLYKRISEKIESDGIVKVLKKGVSENGIEFSLVYAPPKTSKNPESLKLYEKNRLSLIRQLHYSRVDTRNSIDMVAFVNGIPILTIELKNLFTGQNVKDAIAQYKARNPKEKIFKNMRCLAHFALDSQEVFMTTRLEGGETRFLPFNRGQNEGRGDAGLPTGAGNPPSEGVKTAYLWERVMQKDTLLTLTLEYAQVQNDRILFPRYHQFDAVEKLLEDCRVCGVGGRYLIQHSAGSGKSNSIAWLANRLVSLHDFGDKVIFDGVIVINDRVVLDRQIQENINSFEHVSGLVEAITDTSKQLKEALEAGKKIIITTIQKFSFILDSIDLSGGKNFALIIDEAHSSQGGETAQDVNRALGARESEAQEQDIEDAVLEIIHKKQLQPNISYFAFTATPKPQTLELFGTKVEGEEKRIPFHLYPMRQAIEEGFILDVLRGYVTYDSYYRIASIVEDRLMVEKKKAKIKIRGYISKHPGVIEDKSKIMIEHFYNNVYKQVGGRAKAMVVTSSRESAMKYYLAFKRLLSGIKPEFKALVAFSGSLIIDGEEYTEVGVNKISESKLKERFGSDDSYRFLIVAEKYQTGFDEPLLHTMYVDKKLSGISAVQTLSRLNRICKDKNNTCVLDFCNSREDIAEAFGRFYEQTYLQEETDPNKLFDLFSKLGDYGIYTWVDAEDCVRAVLLGEAESMIHAGLDRVLHRYQSRGEDEQEDFYQDAKNFVKLYSFLSQILPYEDVRLEKLSIFLKKLIAKIPRGVGDDFAKGILSAIELENHRLKLNAQGDIVLEGDGALYPSVADGFRGKAEEELWELEEIIREFNEEHGGDDALGERVKVVYDGAKEAVRRNDNFLTSAKNNDRQNAKLISDDIVRQQFGKLIEIDFDFYRYLDSHEELKEIICRKIFDSVMASLVA